VQITGVFELPKSAANPYGEFYKKPAPFTPAPMFSAVNFLDGGYQVSST